MQQERLQQEAERPRANIPWSRISSDQSVDRITERAGASVRIRSKVSSPSRNGMVRSRSTARIDPAVAREDRLTQSRSPPRARQTRPRPDAGGELPRHRLVIDHQDGAPGLVGALRSCLCRRAPRSGCKAPRFAAADLADQLARNLGGTLTLARSMAKYFSGPGEPSRMFSMTSLVPAMTCRRLFNSLAATGTCWRAISFSLDDSMD